MSTVQQIITWVDRKFPNTETDANKILDLDDIHKEIYVELESLKQQFEIWRDVTIADQLTYSLPTGITIDDIAYVKVSEDTVANIDNDTIWNTFKYAGIADDITTGYWYGQGSDGLYTLVIDGEPIDTSDYSIRIYYYKKPASLTSVTDIPNLDPLYHNLLKYALIVSLANQGDNPDTEIADYYQAKYDKFYEKIEKNLYTKLKQAPIKTEQLECRW